MEILFQDSVADHRIFCSFNHLLLVVIGTFGLDNHGAVVADQVISFVNFRLPFKGHVRIVERVFIFFKKFDDFEIEGEPEFLHVDQLEI